MIAYETKITVSAPWLNGDITDVVRSRSDFRKGIVSMLDEIDDGEVIVDWVSYDELRIIFLTKTAIDADVLGSLSAAIADAMSIAGDEEESADVGIFSHLPPGATIH